MFDILILLGGGFLAGTLGGLLGIGGGVMLMPMLRFFVGLSPAHAARTCILAVLFTTLGGTHRHYRQGNIRPRWIYPIMISGALTTLVFSLVFPYLSVRERWLDLGIGLVFSLISLHMIAEGVFGLTKWKKEKGTYGELKGTLLQKISLGSLAGAPPGLLGIGTGAILVPAFTYLLSAPIKVAMASSLACFSVNALISSLFKFWQGFIDLNTALPICLGTLLGARLNKIFSSGALRLAFGLVFAYVSIKFIRLFAG